jgi:UDP:flavonoid glycosyltransferase YjiC (YdhE family)
MKKKIVILASGTRGDVQPYLALGLGLQAAGYRVGVATHAAFRPLVEGRGLPFLPVDGNPSDLMAAPGGQSALTFDGSWLRSIRGSLSFLQAARPLYPRMLESAWLACQGADALVIGLATTWGAHIAEALDIPCLWCFLQPFSRTRLYPSALLPARFSLGGAYNALTHRLVEQAMWLPWRSEINRWRKDTLRLPALSPGSPYSHLYSGPDTVLYAFSPRVAPAPVDWPACHRVTGYWFLDELPGWTPPPELVHFFETGAPPVYIGFGSPGTRQPLRMLDTICQALDMAGLRAVLAFPPEMLVGRALPDTIFPAVDIPHAWLFPRLSAVVHHGGAGTTAAGLRAGLPAILTPLAVDQFFWGERLTALGVAPPPIPQRLLTAKKLGLALQQVVSDTAMHARARVLGGAIRLEDGVGVAVEIIHAQL